MKILSRLALSALLVAAAGGSAQAQFKVIKSAPFPPAVARQKIRTLLENATAENRDQTVAAISEWLDWYRDILDEELIARWKSDARANVPLVMNALADGRVAQEIVAFSWQTDRVNAFTLPYAAMLGDLMERYPPSAKPFLDELLGAPAPALTPAAAQTVCRILIDMPDIGTWQKSAQQVLPLYRAAADAVLKQDLASSDQERVYRAMRWRTQLGLDPPPALSSQKQNTRTVRPTLMASGSPPPASSDGFAQRPHIVGPQAGPQAVPVSGYTGPLSGTFESNGDPIPQYGEVGFPNIPPVKLLLDFDTKHWEARLEPGEGNTQVLVMRNKGKGTQKKCVVHWTVQP